MESLLFNINNNSMLHDISLGNVSNALNRSKLLLNEITKQKDDFSLERDKILYEDEKKSSIYAQFKIETNKYIDEDGDLIELLQSYSKTCAEYSGFLKERLQQLNSNRQKELYNSTLNELDEIDKEKHLWHLIKLLYVDEQNEGDAGERDDENGMVMDNDENEEEAVINEKTIVKRLEKTYPLLRRIRAVIEWLEAIARESDYLRTVRESMSAFSEKCANWEHTFHYLKSANSINKKDKAFFSGRDFVTELDPDAPIRQNKSLHDLDQEDEYKVMEYIFAFIRAGDLDTARDFCFKIGQSWRAATLEGFKLYQDNNYSRANSRSSRLAAANRKEQEVFKNEGNFNRDIWRLMVYKLIKDEHFGPYEKAVYASLAGFVSPVLPVCRTYMDFIWAYFKGLYNKIIDRELRQRITVRDYINMPFDTDEDHLFLSTGTGGKSSDQSSNLPTISQIFERIRVLISSCGSGGSSASGDGLSSSSSSSSFSLNLLNGKVQLVNALKADLNRPYSIILKYVISSGLEGFKSGTNELMDYLKTALIEEKQNGYLLRLSAHLALFYRSASFQIKEDTFIQILDTYSQYLIQHGYKEIIAYYLSQLPAEINIKRYSKFLQTIEDNKERLLLIKLAKERNMNVQAITLNIVDTLSKHSITSLNKRESSEHELTSNMGNKSSVNDLLFLAKQQQTQTLTDEDRTKINAIDWILYDQAQRLKLLEYANLTMRYFLLERKNFEATRLVFAKIPADSVAVVLSQYNYFGSGGNTSAASVLNASTANTTAEANFNAVIENLPQKVSNYIKEYLCFKEYIESIKLYNEWFEFFHKEKPQKPASTATMNQTAPDQTTSSAQDRTFAERMTQEFQLKQYDDLMSRWYSKAVTYSERARAKFLSVLKFPHGGWMCDPTRSLGTNGGDEMSDDDDDEDENNEDENESGEKQSDDENMMEDEEGAGGGGGVETKTCPNSKRQLQLQALRKLYLPNITFVLVDMLAKMNLNKELIKIADLVAARHYKLFELFEHEQMRCFLNKIADSSISLIDSNSDYLGYNN